MKILLKILIVMILFIVTINASQHNKEAYELSAPKDWRKETINFPLDFAPELKYQGFEELRFAPGMFKPESDTYFTYVFFWYLNGSEKITSETLEKDLTLYFKGLCKAVGKERNLNIDLSKVKSIITKQPLTVNNKKKYQSLYQAIINTYDPFNKGEAIKLNLEITVVNTTNQNKTILFFCVSTKPFNSEVWTQLSGIRNTFSIN